MSVLRVPNDEADDVVGGGDLPRYRVLGVPVTAATGTELVDLVASAVETRHQEIILSQNLHGVHTYLHDPEFRRLHDQPGTTIHIDGTPIIWAAKLQKLPVGGEHRTGVIDWIGPLLDAALDGGWRVFHLGGDEAELAAGLATLREQYPGLEIEGQQGFFDATAGSLENQAVLIEIKKFRPDVLLVGMGMGRQEKWVLDSLDQLEVPAIITVGAVMKLLTGELKTPPRWTGRFGVEWLYRFAQQPRATFWRYFIEPWQIAWALVRRRFGNRP